MAKKISPDAEFLVQSIAANTTVVEKDPAPVPLPPTPPPLPPHLRLRAHVEIIAGGQIIYDAPWDMLVPMGAKPELLGVSGQSLDRFMEDASRHAIVAFNRYTEANSPKKNSRRESAADRSSPLELPMESAGEEPVTDHEEMLNTPPASLSDIISMQPNADSPPDDR